MTISENSISGYLDGELLGSDNISNITVSDFGENILSYIGKSDYADDTFAGSFRDLRIYGKEMNEGEVAGLYAEALEIQQVQEAKTTLNLKNGSDGVR